VLVIGMLIEPVQKFAKRSAFEYAFGGRVSAANFQVHRTQELVELNGLHTSQSDDEVQVKLTADRALVKLDMPTLLDKRFVSSRVKLQGLRMELTSLPVHKPTSVADNPWRESLDDVIAAFQWENLRDDCEALLKSDNVLNELESRMRGWLLRSQQIMFHGDQLTRTIQAYSNPLRHQNEIRDQLTQIEQLQIEQDNLQKQFNGISAILASQVKEIQSMGEQDIAAMHTKCVGKATELRTLKAEQIVSEWAKQLVSRQLRLSRSIATLLQTDTRTNPYDVDVRSASARFPLISLSRIEADGFLCDSLQRIPFTATGEYSTAHNVGYQIGRNTAWAIRFDADQIATQLKLASVSTDFSWQIKSTSSESNSISVSASDLSNVGVKNADVVTGVTMLELDAKIIGRRLSGNARLNLGMYKAFAKLPCTANADLATTGLTAGPTTTKLNDHWIEFTLSGPASDAQISLDSRLPIEFTNTVTDSINKRLESQCKDNELKLKLALDAKIDEIRMQLELSAKVGQQTVAKQRDALTAMLGELEQNLQSREGFEYARLPTKPISNR
jgi:hypothetical protein